jgi:hypothetical protein
MELKKEKASLYLLMDPFMKENFVMMLFVVMDVSPGLTIEYMKESF